MRTGGIVAVHAHPDDESITMGGTLARYASMGVPVTLVTATLGEQGEVMDPRLDGITAGRADQLGGYRLAEWQRACAALGVHTRLMLGGLGRFRDSGMAGEPSAEHPRAFIRAQAGGPAHDEAVAALVRVLDEARPAAVLSYDATGGYGHPDHIAAHQVAAAAFAIYSAAGPASAGVGAARLPGVRPAARLLAVVRPRGALRDGLEKLWQTAVPAGLTRPDADELGTLVADDAYDIGVPVGPWAAARRDALAAHATQLTVWAGAVDGFALTNRKAQPLLPTEYFQVLDGPPAPPRAADLLAGM